MTDDLSMQAVIPVENTMSVTYSIKGSNVSECYCEISVTKRVGSEVSAEITPRVLRNSDVKSVIDIKHANLSETQATIHPYIRSSVLSEINVSAGNRMVAMYEVKEPPILTATINPIADTFTKTGNPYGVMNYGGNNSLLLGTWKNEKHKAFINFSLSDWDRKNVIIDAKVRLHFRSGNYEDVKLKASSIDEIWTEFGLTHNNSPKVSSLIAERFNINTENKFLEFDFTEAVRNWTNGFINNYGFCLETQMDEIDKLFELRSRETGNPPELIIKYYDSRIYSAGRTQSFAELFVYRRKETSVKSEVTVSSSVKDNLRLAELYVHRYEDPVLDSIIAEVTATRKETPAEVSVSLTKCSDTLAEATVSVLENRITDAELIVSKLKVNAFVDVPFSNDIVSEIIVFKRLESIIEADLSVTSPESKAEITVKHNNEIFAEVTTSLSKFRERFAEVSISREYAHAEITVSTRDHSEALAEITSIVSKEKVVLSEVSITRELINAEITVYNSSDLNSELFVKYRNEVDAELLVYVHSNVNAEINVVKISNILSEVTATRNIVESVIMVPYHKETEVKTELQVRVVAISDVYSQITVRTKAGAYAFII